MARVEVLALGQWVPLLNFGRLPASGVYCLRNRLTGKEYVGKSVRLRRRMLQHIKANQPYYLHRSMRQDGLENFEMCLLYEGSNDLTEKERQFIAQRGTFAPAGFNMTEGGDGGNFVVWTTEAREAARQRAAGRVQSAEEKAKRSASLKLAVRKPLTAERRAMSIANLAKTWANYKVRGPEVYAKISATQRGRPGLGGELNGMYGFSRGKAPRARAVALWLPESMAPRIFDCVADAAEFAGVHSPTISVWAAGKVRPRSGLLWAYLD